MVCCHMNSRFNLGLRARNRPSSSLFNRKADGIDGNASAFPDSFILEELLVPAEASHSSLFALSSRNERNFRSFVFNHLPTLFTLCKRATRHLASFQSLPHSLQEYPGVGPPLRQNTFISQPPPATRAFRNEAHQATKPANWNWPLLAMSLFRHILTSFLHPEKPYPTPYHLMAKRYRTHPRSVGVYSGFRVCFRCPGLKWSPGFRVCTCKP